MHFDTEGTYTLQYTAEDSCGNETIEERTVEVVTLMTTLFTDGTFIINEKSTDRAANVALHGAVTNEYDPCNPSGSTDAEKYIFNNYTSRPWNSVASSVQAVEIGSPLSPAKTSWWFSDFVACTSMDLHNLDTSTVIDMHGMFNNCEILSSLDVTHFDTSNVTDMGSMFQACSALVALDLSHFDTSKVTNMSGMFHGCSALAALDVNSFNTSNVGSMQSMFRGLKTLTSLDLSSFNTANVTLMGYMFESSNVLVTIYVSPTFIVSQVTNSDNMFRSSNSLVGGAGTAYASSNPRDKTYAHIDGGTSDPGYFTAKS